MNKDDYMQLSCGIKSVLTYLLTYLLMAVVVKGTCKRLNEKEWRALLVVKLMRDDKYDHKY